MAIQYSRIKVRLRFRRYNDRLLSGKELLKYLLPALFYREEEPALRESIDDMVKQYNEGNEFFLQFAVDDNKTGYLIRNSIGYQTFPWDMPIEKIRPTCMFCINVPTDESILKPDFVKGSVGLYLCPECGSIIEDDYQGGKAGTRVLLSREQVKEKYGVDL